jgi:hypothetical protein
VNVAGEAMPNVQNRKTVGQQLREIVSEGAARIRLGIIGIAATVAFLGVPAAFIWMLLPDSVTQPVRYATEYSVDQSHVFIEKKPTDCDWGHAPIGSKDCHYDKAVAPSKNENGRVTDVYVGWNKVPE